MHTVTYLPAIAHTAAAQSMVPQLRFCMTVCSHCCRLFAGQAVVAIPYPLAKSELALAVFAIALNSTIFAAWILQLIGQRCAFVESIRIRSLAFALLQLNTVLQARAGSSVAR
jgi:uncharacterized membrane protein